MMVKTRMTRTCNTSLSIVSELLGMLGRIGMLSRCHEKSTAGGEPMYSKYSDAGL